MKTKCQKIWELVLSLLLVVPLITMNPVKAENVSHKVFELSAPEKASVGDTIDVDLRMYPKDKFAAFDLYINFDEEALKYKSAKLGMGSLGISVEYNQVAPGKLKVAVAKGDEFESNIDDSILITFKMEVLNTKEAVGTHGIQLEVYKSTDVNGGKLDFVNEIKNTQITIDAPLKQISLNKKSLVMDKGNTETLVVSKIPEFTTNTDVVQWSSEDSEIASVDQNGKITAHKGGKTTIKAAIGEFAATCEVTVTIPLESLTIDKLDSAIDVGSKQQLVVKYLPLDTTVNKKVTWKSLDTTIATVDENGIVTGVKRGTATIQATMAGMSTTVEVKVKQPLVGIKIDQSDFTLIKNKEKALTVSDDPSVHDDVIDQKVWSSSDEKIATVDQNGNVKAIKEGVAVISVTYYVGNRTVTSSVKVEVKEIHVTSVSLDKTKVELIKGDEGDLKASYAPLDTTDDTTIQWSSSNDKIVTVDKNGHIKAIAGGKATITAVIAGKKATCDVEVSVPLKGITIECKANVMEVKDTQTLTVKYDPTDTTVDKTITWKSSDKSIATVDQKGVVTALSKGTVDIIATVADKTTNITLTIKQPLLEIQIEQNDFTLIKNETKELTVKESPLNHDDKITKKEWSTSDAKVASVDQNGKATALKEGKATITATYYVGEKSYKATVIVTVKEIHVEKVILNKTNLNLGKGEKATLTATYTPLNTTDETVVKWTSSDSSVVKVNQNGELEAIKGGKATITATIAGQKAECLVKVNVPLTGIELNGAKTVLKGQTAQLTIQKNPSDATDELTNIQYQTSNASIAKVDQNGKVTGLKEGTADISVIGYVGNKRFEAIHSIEVKEIKLESIEINIDSPRIVINEAKQAEVKYNPNDITDDKGVIWSSSDEEIATVDQNGKIKGLKVGKAIIRVVSKFNDEIFDEMEIEVYEIPMESIQLDKESIELTVGDSYQSHVTILPENTTDSKKLTWLSSDEEIATVDSKGNIKALKKGNVVITVSAKNGEIVATLNVKVVNKKGKPSYIVDDQDIQLSVPQDQLQDIYQNVPEEFKEIVNDGGKLDIIVKSQKVENKEAQIQLNNQLSQQGLLKEYQVGTWLNIDVLAQVTSFDGEKQSDELTNLSKPLKITIEIPKDLLGKNREYTIVRIHDGKIEVLKTQLSADKKYLTFESDKFSEFAILYKDVEIKEETNSQKENDKTVHTDDTTLIGMELMGMVISGVVIALSYRKKKYL